MTQKTNALIVSFILVLCLEGCSPAVAGVADDEAIKALYGEAGGQSDAELQAHAFALFNRGTTRGVYGALSPRTRTISPKDYQRVGKAWHTALNGLIPDPTHGATNWLSSYDLKHCRASRMAWRFKMKETAHIGETFFYREK